MAVTIQKGATESMQLPIIPLIDTILNLLIFFLVTAKYAEAERELPVTLPEASEAQPVVSKSREMFINIDSRGRYVVDQKFLTLPELDRILRRAWVNNPGRACVVIRADKRCRWEAVVAAMNSCTKAKIRDYRVTTRDPREGAG
jgi:biopolymer transport protein ExbD